MNDGKNSSPMISIKFIIIALYGRVKKHTSLVQNDNLENKQTRCKL